MLLKDFYKVISIEKNNDQKNVVIIFINKEHDIFKGHFPGNPIMPGVCMMQIIKELTEQITDTSLIMQSLSNVKFMALINPFVNPELRLELDIITSEENQVKVKTITYFDQTVALKFNGIYNKI